MQLSDNLRVISRISHDSDALKVFRGRAHHRRAADVDVLDQFFGGYSWRCCRRRKRIQIYDYKVYRFDFVLRHLSAVVGLASLKQNASVNFWMQRFDAPA